MKVTALRTTKLTAARQSMTPSGAVARRRKHLSRMRVLQIPCFLHCFALPPRCVALHKRLLGSVLLSALPSKIVASQLCRWSDACPADIACCWLARHPGRFWWLWQWPHQPTRTKNHLKRYYKTFHCQANPKLPARIMESFVLCQCLKDFKHPDSKEIQRLHAAGVTLVSTGNAISSSKTTSWRGLGYSMFALQSVLSPREVCGISLCTESCTMQSYYIHCASLRWHLLLLVRWRTLSNGLQRAQWWSRFKANG